MLLGHLSGGADFWAIKRCKHKSKPTEKKSHILPSRRLSQPLAANSKPQMQQRNYNVDRTRACVCETCGRISIISKRVVDATRRSVLTVWGKPCIYNILLFGRKQPGATLSRTLASKRSERAYKSRCPDVWRTRIALPVQITWWCEVQ